MGGRVGFDGDYRGEGCAACHVAYALDGLSDSSDAKAVHGEPGHPARHVMTRAPTTQTCTSCHYGDASIGLNFRGLSQLPPGAPGGPEIKGTTDHLINRQFYLRDHAGPPTCTTSGHALHRLPHAGRRMGTGLHGQWSTRSRSPARPATARSSAGRLATERGTRSHRAEGGAVILTSKATAASTQ